MKVISCKALGLVILNLRHLEVCPITLYDSIVWSTISYGAAIWGEGGTGGRSFSCITAIQNRAARYFIGVGPYTPNAATMEDMGWSSYRSWKMG